MKKVMALALLAVFLAISFAPAINVAAQTEEPVTIDIPVSQIFSILQLYITQKSNKDEPAAEQNKKNNLKKA